MITNRIGLDKEKHTLVAMVELFCEKKHKTPPQDPNLCPECHELLKYSLLRLESCTYGDGKTSCRNCPTHCYSSNMRERVRSMMRYTGPRMLFHHPVMALEHAIREIRLPRIN